MPRVNIFIRADYYEAWQAIKNKPKWIHDNLDNTSTRSMKLPQFDKPILVSSDVSVCKGGYVTRAGKKKCDMVKLCKVCY